ncbi:MAG TPA: response regulator [Candidatus Methylacidiphilales bacterium]|jgi:CheY-like chemotaxis protein|nr:response regulator [Candidatus Methylacidiphilales bacterium]
MKRILLADDSPQDTELTLTALEEFNLADEVMTVHDGVEALDYLYHQGEFSESTAETPLVVILDLKMPRIDGLEVLRRMKRDPVLQSIPVVMLTSSREDCDLVESYQLGVNAYVVKPVEYRQFVQAVRQLGVFWATVNEPPPGSRPKSATQRLPKH